MTERANRRWKFWVEASLATITAILTVVTLISREWIEILFGVDPDNGNGLMEWAIVVAFAGASLVFSVIAFADWRKIVAEPSP